MDAGGDAAAAAEAAADEGMMNSDAVKDTYVDTLNLWVGILISVIYHLTVLVSCYFLT